MEEDLREAKHRALGDVDKKHQWPRMHERREMEDGSALVWWRWPDGTIVGPSVAERRESGERD